MIHIESITKQFPTVTALDNISLSIQAGEFFGLLGPNGAGKSTLMNLLIGYLEPDSGTITIAQERVDRHNLSVRRQIGLVPQSIALYDDLPAIDNLLIFGRIHHLPSAELKEKVDARLHAVGLYDRRKDRVKTFSGGMKRRLNLVASLLHEPQVLLCDEPTVGVDPQSRNAIFDYLTELNDAGLTIVYTTHYMEEAERLCDRLAIIDHGQIIATGTVDDLLSQLPYDESIRILKTPDTTPKLDTFSEFGELIERDLEVELRPASGFKLSTLFMELEKSHIPYTAVELHRPTLEALFLHLTGRRLRD